MSWTFDDTNRQAFPRWIDYPVVCSLGLLRNIRGEENALEAAGHSLHAGQQWQSTPSLATAVDLLGEALILKNFKSDEAIKAAYYILNKAPTSSLLIRELASHFLEQPSLYKNASNPMTQIDFVRERIARLKKSVRAYPVNPISWSDLSLCYAILGQVKKARLAMEVALGLGRNNRFILRSAARCFAHMKEPDRAVEILRRSDLCSFDPWITSAEIAICEGMGLRSKCVAKAKRLIDDDNFTYFSRSELTVGMGTMEIRNGSTRRAKQLLRQGLRDPTENALAQAEWMATQLHIDIDQLGDKVPASYEAQARHFYRDKQFANSLTASEMWGQFHPLSAEPFMFSSFIAAVCLNDNARVVRLVENALPALRNEPMLMNNHAFALARLGKVADAKQVLRGVNPRVMSECQKFTLCATEGLISFRMDDAEQGRKLYSLAIRDFERINETRSATIAAYFWAIEEKRIRSPYAASRIKDAKGRIDRFGVFELEDLAKRL